MDSVATLWTLAAMFLSGLQLFFQKVVAQEGRGSALNGVLMYGISGLMAFTASFFLGVPIEWQVVAFFAVGAGLVHAIGNFIRIEGLKYIDSVIFFPLNKVLGPLVVLLGGVLIFGEQLSRLQLLGVVISICVPLLLLSSSEKHRQNNLKLGLIFLVVSTVLTSASQLITKQGLFFDPSIFFMLGASQLAGCIMSLGIHVRGEKNRQELTWRIHTRDVQLGFIAAFLGFVSFFSLLKAMTLGPLSIVYTIHAHYILVPIVLSIWWYGEHIDRRKIAAVAISFLAIGLLV